MTTKMQTLTDITLGGERPLFESHNLRLERVTITEGESAIKECSDVKLSTAALKATILSGMSTASQLTDASSMSVPGLDFGIHQSQTARHHIRLPQNDKGDAPYRYPKCQIQRRQRDLLALLRHKGL